MKDKDWIKLITRRVAPQVLMAWNYGFDEHFKKRYGAAVKNSLVYCDGNKTDYFVDKNELAQFNRDLDALLDDHHFVLGMVPEAKEFVEETYEYVKALVKNAADLGNRDLCTLYEELTVLHSEFYTRMWMAFRICERIVMKVEELLESHVGSDKAKELSRTFSVPVKPNDVTNERMDLLRLALEGDESKIAAHAAKYRHIPMFDFDHEPYNEEHFLEQLYGIEDATEELARLETSYHDREKKFRTAMQHLAPSPELEHLIVMLKKAVYLRDYRDMVRQKLNLCLRDFYQVIGDRIGLRVEDTALLTNQEIVQHLKRADRFNKHEIKKRQSALLLYQCGNKIEICSGEDARKRAELLQLYGEIEAAQTLQGLVGSQGTVSGRARIVYTNKDLTKVKQGDILVAAMTRQDFVPAMRKAKAIITDEGSVTCHAAIIARELGIPCVVGAKGATDMLKDGMQIKLDGKGKIVILN